MVYMKICCFFPKKIIKMTIVKNYVIILAYITKNKILYLFELYVNWSIIFHQIFCSNTCSFQMFAYDLSIINCKKKKKKSREGKNSQKWKGCVIL